MNQCTICSQEMSQIPAGVSKKTGKPYSAFMSCPNRCKASSPNMQNNASMGDFRENLAPPISTPTIAKPSRDSEAFGKCKHGFLEIAYKEYLQNINEIADFKSYLASREEEAEMYANASMRKLDKPEIRNFGQGIELDQMPSF